MWLELLATFALLVAGLGVIVAASRKPSEAARDLKGLGRYDADRQLWAVALLSGMAIGEIASSTPGAEWASLVALGVGVLCGWSRSMNLATRATAGTIGVLASVIGSVQFVMSADSESDRVLRLLMAGALALLFGLASLVRLEPLGGLTWFAVLDVVVFLSSPVGVSWADLGVGSLAGLAVVIAVAALVAIAPGFVIGLLAAAVVIVQLIGSGLGYLPGNFLYSATSIVLVLVSFFMVRWVRRRFS